MRVEHEYERGGALAYLAAWDVRRAKVFGRCESTTGIEPFGRLVEQVMVQEPYASARRVFWILDNGSSHRGKASVERLQAAWPTLKVVHLPVHARSLLRATLPRSRQSKTGSSASKHGSSRARDHSSGSSTAPTWPASWRACRTRPQNPWRSAPENTSPKLRARPLSEPERALSRSERLRRSILQSTQH